jgi:hypothetical protein
VNRAQRAAHLRLWPLLLIVILAVVGGALAVRESVIEAGEALRAMRGR